MMHRNKSASSHSFAMVPRADIPRASFKIEKAHKTTFDAGYLVPVFLEEILPGDTFHVKMTAFARLSTPIFPIMDNLYLDSFFFFVPNRLVWDNWVKFMGEQEDPTDSISYAMPILTKTGGYAVGTLYDHFGLATEGQIPVANQWSHQTLPLRAYNLIWHEWFRDQNLQNSPNLRKGDTGDVESDYPLRKRNKRHDYFTSALPWPQKGGVSVPLPLGSSAPVRTGVTQQVSGAQTSMGLRRNTDGVVPANTALGVNAGFMGSITGTVATAVGVYPDNLYADLSQATAATINQLRQAFQVQRLLERDARGGTRYTEIIRAHFGVISPDARLNRPEYLGGGSAAITLNPVAQTSATGVSGGTTPAGTLSAVGTVVAHGHGFSQSFTEHGYVIGLVSVRADLTYQQGVRKLWSRNTRYDFYFPAFAMLGEQVISLRELYALGGGEDTGVFGYQERWAEYRYSPSMITGRFRSTSLTPLDAWHLSQKFTTPPTLGQTFIAESPPVERVLAIGAAALGAQFIFDSFFEMQATRPLPMYSVPGMIDHF